MKFYLIVVGCGAAVSLAAQNMQAGFARGLVFGLVVGIAHSVGRIQGARRA